MAYWGAAMTYNHPFWDAPTSNDLSAAWALVQALKDEGIDRLQIPFGSLALVVLLGGIAGVIAAILPARRAAKLDILRAIVTE